MEKLNRNFKSAILTGKTIIVEPAAPPRKKLAPPSTAAGKHKPIDATNEKNWPRITDRLVERLEYRQNYEVAALFRSCISLIVTGEEFAFFFPLGQRKAIEKVKADSSLMVRLKSTIQANTNVNNARIVLVPAV